MISVFAGQNWTTMPLTQWMATAQLRLLTIFGCQLISDTVQQLDYTLLWILLESVDKCPRHSTRGLGSYRGIRTWRIDQNSEGSNIGGGGGPQGVGLRSLVTRPHYHIGRRRLRRHCLIVSVIAPLGFLEEAH
jgi:hypothetical protein